jgi:hypothetical protein
MRVVRISTGAPPTPTAMPRSDLYVQAKAGIVRANNYDYCLVSVTVPYRAYLIVGWVATTASSAASVGLDVY